MKSTNFKKCTDILPENSHTTTMKKSIVAVIAAFVLFAAVGIAHFPSLTDAIFTKKPSSTNAENSVSAPPMREIAHIFTHALLADASLAFAKNNPMRTSYDRDCVTVREFKSVLQSLYENNFALIDINSVFKDGKRVHFDFPADKKPLILSFDDINYYVKKMHLGMNDKLVLQNGKVGALLNGKIQYDNEVVTVLENFVSANPDFSYRGAKGVLCLTGFDGILGYRTQSDSPDRDKEIASVTPLVSHLKQIGWRFACHSYGHYHMKKISVERFKTDTQKWLDEVAPLVGQTDIYVYPYGEWEVLDAKQAFSTKQEFLNQKGFSLFCGVGIKPYFTVLPNTNEKVLMMDRIPLDGLTLRARKEQLKPYFDVDVVYDAAVRPKKD